MKQIIALAAIFSVLIVTGCKKNDDNNNGTITTAAVSSNIIKGQWQISYFIKNNTTLTTDFSGYKLTFFADGKVNALPSLYTIQGNWTVSDNNGVTLSISSFTVPASFQSLNGSWLVVTNTATLIKFTGATGSTDQIILEPI